MSENGLHDEYMWFEMASSDTTVDSPFFASLGNLTILLSIELEKLATARKEEEEIEVRRVPVEGKPGWRRIEVTHPTKDPYEIRVQLNSLASEGIACAIIVSLSRLLRSLSGSFELALSVHKVCPMGPMVGNTKWVDGVVAASNYVRHRDEWLEDSREGNHPNHFQKQSVDSLQNSGIANVWECEMSFVELVDHLGIGQWESLSQNISNWLKDCLPYHPGYR